MKLILMMAITLDGIIAKDEGHFTNWTSKEDKQAFLKISKEHGAVIMGRKTFSTFPAPLKERLNLVYTNQNLESHDNVIYVSGEPGEVLKAIEKKGYKSALLAGGSAVNSLFLKNNLIDEIIVTIEPKIFGQGLSLFSESFDVNLELLEFNKLGENSLLLKYKVIK